MGEASQWVVNASALVTAIGILWAAGAWVARAFRRELNRVLKVLNVIEAEFRPNGGGTLRDLVALGNARQAARDDIDSEPGFEADAHGNFIRANRALQRLSQRGSDAFLGSEWEHIVADSDRERVWDAWCDAVHRGRTFEATFDIVAIDGSRYAIDCIAAPVRDGEKITGWIGKYRHVEQQQDTRRKRRA